MLLAQLVLIAVAIACSAVLARARFPIGLDFQGGAMIAIETGGEVRRYWNHDPDRIARALELFGPDAQLQDRWGLFGIPNGKGTYLFSIVRLEPDGSLPEGTVSTCSLL